MNRLCAFLVIVSTGCMLPVESTAQVARNASVVKQAIDQSFRELRDDRGSIAGKSEAKRQWRDRLIEAADAHPSDPARWDALNWAGRFSLDLEDWSTARDLFMRIANAEQAPATQRMNAAERVTGMAFSMAVAGALEPWQPIRAYEVFAATFPQWQAEIDPRLLHGFEKVIQRYARRLQNAPGQTSHLVRAMMQPNPSHTPDHVVMLQRTMQWCEAYLAKPRDQAAAELGAYEPMIRGMALHCLTLAHTYLGDRRRAVEGAVRFASETPNHPEARRVGALFIDIGSALCEVRDFPWPVIDTQEYRCLRAFLEEVETHVPAEDETWFMFHQYLITSARTADDREAVVKRIQRMVDSRHPAHVAFFSEHPDKHRDLLDELASTLVHLRRYAEAVPYYRLLTERHPDTRQGRLAIERLQVLSSIEQTSGK
jgi:hypothetical protein